jgi:hypothetical protein
MWKSEIANRSRLWGVLLSWDILCQMARGYCRLLNSVFCREIIHLERQQHTFAGFGLAEPRPKPALTLVYMSSTTLCWISAAVGSRRGLRAVPRIASTFPDRVRDSAQKLADLPVEAVLFGHGDPILRWHGTSHGQRWRLDLAPACPLWMRCLMHQQSTSQGCCDQMSS